MSEPRQPLVPRPGSVDTVMSPFTVVALILFVALTVVDLVLIETHSIGTAAAMGTIPVAFAAVLAVSWIVNRVGARRFRPHNEEGVRALVRGEADRAARVFEEWTGRATIGVRCVARHNLGLARARRGELRAAIALFADNERRMLRGQLRASNATQLALCLCLVGELDLAEAWLVESELRASNARRGEKPSAAYVRAVLDCRRGRANEAARELDRLWPDIEGIFGAFVARPVRVVHAFARGQVGGPREAGAATQLLGDARPRFSGEYDWLGAEWPEMRVFLGDNGLAGKA